MIDRSETDVLQGRGRFVAVLACLAVVAHGWLLPGTRAFGSGKVLTALEYASPILLTASALFAWVFAVRAAYSLAFPSALSAGVRIGLGAFAIAGLSISLPAFRGHAAPFMLAILQLTGSLACLAAAFGALGRRGNSHGSRPLAFALFAIASSGVSRFTAHFLIYGVELAADPNAHPHWLSWGRALTSLSLVLEAAVLVLASLVVARVVALIPPRQERFSAFHAVVAVAGGGAAAAITLLSLDAKSSAVYTFFKVSFSDMETGALPSMAPSCARFLGVWSPIVAVSLVATGLRRPEFSLLALLCLSRGALDVPVGYYFAMLGAFGIALTVGRRAIAAPPRNVDAAREAVPEAQGPISGPTGPLH